MAKEIQIASEADLRGTCSLESKVAKTRDEYCEEYKKCNEDIKRIREGEK
jgi:hypothetical protein